MSLKIQSALLLGLALSALAIGNAGCAGDLAGAGGAGGSEPTPTSSGTGGTGGSHLPPGTCVMKEDCAPLTGDPCNVAGCLNGMCVKLAANEGAVCEDGLFCTVGDKCHAGACVGGGQKDCAPPGDTCQIGSCDEANKKCSSAPGNNGAACEDGNPCTSGTTCANGVCTGGTQSDCSVFDGQCTVGGCDPVTGCKPMPANDGAQCEDGKASPCSTGICGQGNCTSVPANEGGPCDDHKYCTMGDHCENAVCVPTGPTICAPPGGCFVSTCDEQAKSCTSVPGNDGDPCDDFNSCTTGTTCLSGLCTGGQATNEGLACDDAATCTSNTICQSGVCGGGQGPIVYLADDFHDNSKGWQLDTEWGIASAQASSGEDSGYPDPASDHSPTADNGVAGVDIGGNAPIVVHGYYYMTSPAFDTSNAQGSVILGFYRFLNSDYTPYMTNDIEVYDGASWVPVWESGMSPGIEDDQWMYIEHDLTAYKNATMRVRFGFKIGQISLTYSMSSWNIDDLLIASAGCP